MYLQARHHSFKPLAIAMLLAAPALAAAAEEPLQLQSTEVLGTAQEELKQALGVSVITAEDIQKAPPANDIAEIIRKQPGVNLTGNSGSGARGNNRQIDIRGMGPENTLILIDGWDVPAPVQDTRHPWCCRTCAPLWHTPPETPMNAMLLLLLLLLRRLCQ